MRIDCYLPAECRTVSRARGLLHEWLDGLGFSEEECSELGVAVSEACANAVQHGSPLGAANLIHVIYEVLGGHLVIEVVDQGDGFEFHGVRPPAPHTLQESGLGLYLMQSMVNAVEVDRRDEGTLVRLWKELPPAAGKDDNWTARHWSA